MQEQALKNKYTQTNKTLKKSLTIKYSQKQNFHNHKGFSKTLSRTTTLKLEPFRNKRLNQSIPNDETHKTLNKCL